MGGVMGIAAAVFGVIWTLLAARTGGGLFALFGLVFIAVAVINAVYNFKNASSKNRYSAFDITDHSEEPDPLNERFGAPTTGRSDGETNFCPYCGTAVESDHEYCRKCGKRIR